MNSRRYEHVMAVIPNTRGVAYVVFEAPFVPVGWAVMDLRGKNRTRQCVQRITRLFGQYQPAVVVLQDMSEGMTRRPVRIQRINEAIALFAETQGVEVVTYARQAVRAGFAAEGYTTKQRIAEAIAKRVPMFERLVPPPRKLWQNEHARMGLFDAAALAVTFYRADAHY